MAQALFTDHPIEEYLRESGEITEVLPGGIYEFVKEPGLEDYGKPIENAFLRSFVNRLFKTSSFFCPYASLERPSQSQQFAERFKYLIISSSLLSTSLPSSHSTYAIPIAPGHYPSVSSPPPSPVPLSSTINIFIPIPSQALTFIILCLIFVFLTLGYYAITLLALLVAQLLTADQAPSEASWSSTLEVLETLIRSNNSWESTMSELLKLLENEHSSLSSLHSFRPTFFETLRAIQTQCDDVRQLLAAISLPDTIAQLSPMYAPPSPSRMEPQFGFSIPNRRPLSLVASSDLAPPTVSSYHRSRTKSQSSYVNKRATWNAPYASSAYPVNSSERDPAFLTMNKSRIEPQITYSASAPPTPFVNDKGDFPEEPFGVTALSIRRRKRFLPFNPPTRDSLTGLIGSGFTSLMSSFPKSDPRIAIQTTLAAKRYTCSHLLALRFPDSSLEKSASLMDHVDSSDEGYWEDVRTVICLLTNVLKNSTNKLNDILEQHRSEMADDSLAEEAQYHRESSVSSNSSIHIRSNCEIFSFAPMPSQIYRFAAHIDVISSALEEARSNLRQCVEALTEGGDDLTSVSEESFQNNLKKSAVIHVYDELRRTLSHALRECERGRQPLRNLLGAEPKSMMAEKAGSLAKVIETENEHRDERFSSCDSDKTLYNIENHCLDFRDEDQTAEDDATNHLLYAASEQYIPQPGVEQVFEGESTPISFTRPRSKLSREERVALVKAQRKDGTQDPANITKNRHAMGLGPGDEVVQELKDVIWKVGEQRRRMHLSRISTSSFLQEI